MRTTCRRCCCCSAARSRSASARSRLPRASASRRVDGVQRIPEAMAAALAGGVELDHAVAAIALEADRARRHLRQRPPLQRRPRRRGRAAERIAAHRDRAEAARALQAEAIATLPSQPLTQVYLAPRSRFWEQDGYAASLFTDTRAGMLAAARNRDDPTEVTSLTAWITGENAAALDRLASPADAGRAVIAAIETLRPAARASSSSSACTRGVRMPHAGGAWAYFRPGEVTRFARGARAARTGGYTSAASISRRRAAAWKARWSRPKRPLPRFSKTPETRAAAWVPRPSHSYSFWA